jgi:hypothetical protein
MGQLVIALALAVLLLGSVMYTFGTQIGPAANDAGESTALSIRQAFE